MLGELQHFVEQLLGLLWMLFPVLQYLLHRSAIPKHFLVKASCSLLILHLHDLPDGVVVLVVRDIGDQMGKSVGEHLAQLVHQHRIVFLCAILDKVGHINGLTEVDHTGGTVAEIVTVFDTHGHEINRFFLPELLVGVQRDMEDAFAQLQQRVFGTMSPFGKQVKTHFVVNHIHGLFHRLRIVTDGSDAIPDSVQWEDTGKPQQLGNGGVGEDVSPSHEHLFMMAGGQNHQSIHQGVAVVDAIDQGTILGELFLSMNLKTPV